MKKPPRATHIAVLLSTVQLSWLTAVAALALAWSPNAHGQAVKLDFTNVTTAADGYDSEYGHGPSHSSSVIYFTNVATVGGTSIDMRATATILDKNYAFEGHFANYSQSSSQLSGDLGSKYTANALGIGRLQYELDFYVGGGTFTTPYAISEFDLLVYDVDGEERYSKVEQSESLSAYTPDGLYCYRLADNINSVKASPISDGIRFDGPGYNLSSTDTTAAVLLTYKNSSHVKLVFESNTFSGTVPNPVFQAIDGDSSMLKGDYSSFDTPVIVPEPSAAALLAVTGLFTLGRRRRV
ncbi:MAG: PEP-CTERM sorting domain-containing protein [Akkermansiaceae bacterium]|nr:PEP-CTERM sorting domain-containing protein [Akkermansiaceae bacterium]